MLKISPNCSVAARQAVGLPPRRRTSWGIAIMAGVLFLMTALNLTPAAAQDYKIGDIELSGLSARAMLPGAKVGGAYLTIINHGNEDDRLISISSDRASPVQIHEMKIDNGVMTMRELKAGITIPAGQTVTLKPGGYHLMFMNVTQPFRKGETVKAKLTFEKAGAIELELPVGTP